ncbi:MAG: hypothetical protein ACRC0F_06240 [Cetobacterium sp.]
MKKYSTKNELVLSAINNGGLYNKYEIGEKVAKRDLRGLLEVIEKMVLEQVKEYNNQFNEGFKKDDIKKAVQEIKEYYIQDMKLSINLELVRLKNSISGNPIFKVKKHDNIEIMNYLIVSGLFKINSKNEIKTLVNASTSYEITNNNFEYAAIKINAIIVK